MALVTNGLTIPAAGTVNSTSSSADARQLPVAGARSVVPLVYGTDRISGLVLNVLPAGTGSTTLLVQVLWCFAAAGVSDVRLNGQALPAGSTVTHYLGGQSTADSALVAAFDAQGIAYTTTLAGYAYSVVAMPNRAFDGELAITGLVQGRKLYDPRKDSTNGGSGIHRLDTPGTWEHNDCPALALADFLSNATYGAGEAVVWSSVATLANANDATVGSPAEKRRTLGLSLMKAAPVRDWAETLRAYAGAWLVPTAGGLKLVPDAAGSAVATYTHAAGQIEAIEPLQLRDLGDSPTVVEVIYTDTSAVPWRDASAAAMLSGAGTTKPWRVSTVRLPGIQRYSQAMREATERLNKLNLSTLTTRVTLFDEAAAHEQGDIIRLTHPCGLSLSEFRVLAPERLQSGSWALDVAQYSAAVYNDAVVTRTSFGDPSFVNPAGPPSMPTGLAVGVEPGGTRIRWAGNPESDVASYELRQGGTDWASASPLVGAATRVGGTSFVWSPAVSGNYTLRLVAIDDQGNASEPAVLVAYCRGTALDTLQLATTGAVEVVGNTATKPASATAGWNAAFWGRQGYAGGAFVAFSPAQANAFLCVGLSTDPGASADIDNVRFGLECTDTGQLLAVESGTSAGVIGTYAAGDSCAVAYDGTQVRYYKNGQVLRTVTEAIAFPLYPDSSFFTPGAVVVGLQAGPLSSTATATAAAAAAASALASATTANTAISALVSDSVLSRAEKPQAVQDWLAVDNEKAGIVAQADAYSITTQKTAYTTAHTALYDYLTALSPSWSDTSQDTPIDGAVYRAKWVTLYDARQTLLNKIAEIAGTRAAWSGVTGSGKPADNATVGATFGVNIYGTAETVHLAATAVTNRVLFQDLTGDTRSNVT